MIVSLLVAIDQKRGIGKDGRIPWRLPADQQRFKRLTMGHHLVIGRLTYESIGRPLPGRTMLVVTSQQGYQAPGCTIVSSLDQALELARRAGEDQVFIAGGARLYAEALPLADRLYLTQVHAQVDADTFFPHFDESNWVETAREHHPRDQHNQFDFTYRLLVRPSEPAN